MPRGVRKCSPNGFATATPPTVPISTGGTGAHQGIVFMGILGGGDVRLARSRFVGAVWPSALSKQVINANLESFNAHIARIK
jgi:hypothetical protein